MTKIGLAGKPYWARWARCALDAWPGLRPGV